MRKNIFFIFLLFQSVLLFGQSFNFFNENLFAELDKIFNKEEELVTSLDEYYLGRAVAANILGSYELYTQNQELQNYLNLICKALVINSSYPPPYNGYFVMILNSPTLNAFATSGGHIFLTKGFIDAAPSEDALAAIIAHELSHIMLKHGINIINEMKINEEIDIIARRAGSFSNNNNQVVFSFRDSVNEMFYILTRNGYSVAQEYEADITAINLLNSAGYNRKALLDILNILQKSQRNQKIDLNSTHPEPQQRISNIERKFPLINRTVSNNTARMNRFNRIMGRRSN